MLCDNFQLLLLNFDLFLKLQLSIEQFIIKPLQSNAFHIQLLFQRSIATLQSLNLTEKWLQLAQNERILFIKTLLKFSDKFRMCMFSLQISTFILWDNCIMMIKTALQEREVPC